METSMIKHLFIRPSIGIASVLMLIGLGFGQEYKLEWEIENTYSRRITIPSYYGSNSVMGNEIILNEQYEHGNGLDLENDGIPEYIFQNNDSSVGIKDIQIYDGKTHVLKYSVSYGEKFFDPLLPIRFFDVDGDNDKEIIIGRNTLNGMPRIEFLNVKTDKIEFIIDSAIVVSVFDLDNDSYPELFCRKYKMSAQKEYLQVWGSGSSSVTPSPIKRQLAAYLKSNVPNPFISLTKIEYYVPSAQHVNLNIYNANGRLVRSMVNKSQKIG